MRTKKSRKRSVILTTGDLVYTPAMMAHATEFLEDTLILALTKQSRASKNYEADTVRIKLI